MNFSNRLVNETSPYLLQHAHNPVDWFPWCDEALDLAKKEDKLILVSIGYSACHWCHVMEKESFEDAATALLMNKYFVCIKVDREERPDLDHFFMDALQAIAGQGGWPLNMFLTPDGKPFYGGTYFPPQSIPQRISWKELLVQLHDAFIKRRPEIEAQANNLLEHLQKSNQLNPLQNFNIQLPVEEHFSDLQLKKILEQLMSSADLVDGGFGHAPKFPQTYAIQFLLRHYHFFGTDEALQHALLSLKKMIRGGIYDHVGGGFCRYSTDAQWKVPHFEKMAYDNALLLMVLTEAYQISKDEEIKDAVFETVAFLKREMLDAEGGFYAALDADSEGVEGKFYVWSKNEFDEVVGTDASILHGYFNISDVGNWEHSNILFTKASLQEWSVKYNLDNLKAKQILSTAKHKLLVEREKRVRPGLDDKIILGWNALLSNALLQTALVFEQQEWEEISRKNIDFILDKFFDHDTSKWLHTYKDGKAKYSAFLDDLAYLIQALIQLHETTGSFKYLQDARSITEYLIEHFSDTNNVYFYFTPSFETDVPVRKVDLYDGATPSGNSIMAWNLIRLGIIFDQSEWKQRSYKMLKGVESTLLRYPTSFGKWGNLLLELNRGLVELAIIGKNAKKDSAGILRTLIPNKIVVFGISSEENIPLLKGRPIEQKTVFYVCHDYTCQAPTENPELALKFLLTKRVSQ
jgi:uncharacterized protein YyaL (SSP411 family)